MLISTIQMGELQKLTKLLENFKKIQSELTEGIGEIAVTEFVLNFRRQGFNGNIWKAKKKPNGKNILIRTGTLRRSIKVLRQDKTSITVGSNLKYAKIHNDGLQGKAWGKYKFIMPKRQFIGDMPSLTKKITNYIKKKLKQA